jgi:hypothetical protein
MFQDLRLSLPSHQELTCPADGEAQVIKSLPSKYDALSSTVLQKKKKKELSNHLIKKPYYFPYQHRKS